MNEKMMIDFITNKGFGKEFATQAAYQIMSTASMLSLCCEGSFDDMVISILKIIGYEDE
jgi:hypothetical protein